MVNCLSADRCRTATRLTAQLTTHRTTQRNADKHKCFAYAHDTTHDTNHGTNHGTHFIIIIIKRSFFVRASACASARARTPNAGPMQAQRESLTIFPSLILAAGWWPRHPDLSPWGGARSWAVVVVLPGSHAQRLVVTSC